MTATALADLAFDPGPEPDLDIDSLYDAADELASPPVRVLALARAAISLVPTSSPAFRASSTTAVMRSDAS